MSRSAWTVEVKDSADSWTSDGNLYRPNEDLEIPQVSTQQRVKAADGSDLFFIPETKYVYDPIVFKWFNDDGTTKDKIEGYLMAGEDLRLTDHNANTYVGRFIDLKIIWLTGQSPDAYDLEAAFQIMPNL